MSLTTFFQFTHTSYLPLPPTKPPPPSTQNSDPPARSETADQIQSRGLKTAISMLHQPPLMISLNPLVQHYSLVHPENTPRLVNLTKLAPEFNVTLAPTPSVSTFEESKNGEFVHYEIIDKFEFLGGLTSKLMTYRACFRPLYDAEHSTIPKGHGRESIGLETISDPGSGVSLLGKWVVDVDETRPGYLVLRESVQVHCNVFLGWYVRGQLEGAHEMLHKEFGRRFCERMVEEDPGRGMDGKGRAGKRWRESVEREGRVTGSTGGRVSRVGTGEMK
ncbi:hypothetical protein PMZ80_001772 [Knufia obscura]|uniref:DUF7053 domain-containing protein n=1 Tax=Knufia obscura TaxID=1635080 RepID=A0ABR0S5I5_9EURO|nr:hypothetical protein PMZ80_001772 [Knufia obscura]